MDDDDPSQTLAQLKTSLGSLETALAPLLSQPLDETRDALAPLDRAKLDILLAYTINDLVWIYLKTKGVDPETHDVTRELDRMKSYYTKVSAAEDSGVRRTTVDREAAHRFVSAAIPRAQRMPPVEKSGNGGGKGEEAPSTSAAALANAQAEERYGMAGRFRHIQKDDGREVDEDEEEEEEEADDAVVQTEALLASVQDELEDEDEDGDMDGEGEQASSNGLDAQLDRRRRKRKRAEDIA